MNTVFTNEKDERFLNLVKELDLGYYRLIGDELRKYDKYNEFKTPHVVALYIESGEAVACTSYRTVDEDNVEFKRVYVKPDYRKKKIAYGLIKELEEDVVKNGYKHSFIVTGKNNHPAIKLYEKLDYYPIAKFGQFKDDENIICMKKDF